MKIVITEDVTNFFKDPMVAGITLEIEDCHLDFILKIVSMNNVDIAILSEEEQRGD